MAEVESVENRWTTTIRPEIPVFGILALLATVWLANNLRLLGIRIDQPDIGIDYAMGIFWWVLIAVGIASVRSEDQQLLLMAWLVKFFVVLIVMLFYEQRYGLDANWYFKVTVTGEHPHYLGVDWRKDWYLFQDPFEAQPEEKKKLGQGTDNMIRIVMFLSMFVGKYYHALKVVFSFFGLLGSWAFYRAVVVVLGRRVPAAFYWLAFFPSILFWSSILGKDPLIFLFLGVMAYGGARMLILGQFRGLFIVAIGSVFAYNVRPWTALMAACALVLAVLLRRGHAVLRLTIILTAAPAMLFAWGPIKDRFHIDDLKSVEKLYVQLTEGQDIKSEWTTYQAEFGGSQRVNEAIEMAQQVQSGNLTGALPVIVFTGLFRPLPFDARNIFSGFAALENSLLLILVVVAIWRLKSSTLRDPMVIWAMSYCLLWSVLHGPIVMANFGAGVRYKLQMLPFMVLTLFLLLHREGYKAATGLGPTTKLWPLPDRLNTIETRSV